MIVRLFGLAMFAAGVYIGYIGISNKVEVVAFTGAAIGGAGLSILTR